LLRHNAVLGTGTVTAGMLGVAFQSVVSHGLRPAEYGAVFAVVTAISFIGLPATAFAVLMARETSRGRASGHEGPSATLLRRGNMSLLLFGLVLAGVLALGSRRLSQTFDVPAGLWLAAALGLPCALALPLLLGEFQGEQRFGTYALLSVGQAALKLLGALMLGILVGPVGVILGISVATIAVYIVALRVLRRKFRIRPNVPWARQAGSYLAVILPSTLALAVLLSSDVLLVKHYFPSAAAGQYAAVAAIGRAIFWGSSAVAAVLFPKLAFQSAVGNRGAQLVGTSLLLVVLGGAVGFGVLSVGAHWLLSAFSGGAYGAAAGYLPWYAVAMTLLGAVAVLIAAHQSRGRPGFLLVLIPLAAAEPLVIVLFHQTLMQVVQVMAISIAIVSAGLATLYFAERPATSREVPPFESVAGLTQVRINQ
jgi:O-antigen/teichoic acid export membrane protein